MRDRRATNPKRATWLITVMVLSACGGVTVPEGPASQTGEVVERRSSSSIWVKNDPDEECGVVYDINDDTELFTRDSRRGPKAIDAVELL